MMMDCNFLVVYTISFCSLQTHPADTGCTFAVQHVLALLSTEQLAGNTGLPGDSVGAQIAPNQLQ